MRVFYLNDNSSDNFSESEDENVHVVIEMNNIEFEDKYFSDIEKVNFYKKKLEYEPEFIGIKNISSASLLSMINSINKDTIMDIGKLSISENTKKILDDLFNELLGHTVDEYYQKILIKKINNKCYC